MTSETHLTEEERHGLADQSLEPERLAAAEAHRRGCAECSVDVERIGRLMKRAEDSVSHPGAAPAATDDLWPAIRSRIEERKVVRMPGAEAGGSGVHAGAHATGTRRWLRRRTVAVGGVLAAGMIGLWYARDRVTPADPTVAVEGTESGVSLISVVDSTHAYQEEAQALLNRLELERATMRPELSRALERDLRTIDVAIAELEGAIRSDPANPALRRLLASSYRQKVDLLKRVSNAS